MTDGEQCLQNSTEGRTGRDAGTPQIVAIHRQRAEVDRIAERADQHAAVQCANGRLGAERLPRARAAAHTRRRQPHECTDLEPTDRRHPRAHLGVARRVRPIQAPSDMAFA